MFRPTNLVEPFKPQKTVIFAATVNDKAHTWDEELVGHIDSAMAKRNHTWYAPAVSSYRVPVVNWPKKLQEAHCGSAVVDLSTYTVTPKTFNHYGVWIII
jgi:hypothetical protein